MIPFVHMTHVVKVKEATVSFHGVFSLKANPRSSPSQAPRRQYLRAAVVDFGASNGCRSSHSMGHVRHVRLLDSQLDFDVDESFDVCTQHSQAKAKYCIIVMFFHLQEMYHRPKPTLQRVLSDQLRLIVNIETHPHPLLTCSINLMIHHCSRRKGPIFLFRCRYKRFESSSFVISLVVRISLYRLIFHVQLRVGL